MPDVDRQEIDHMIENEMEAIIRTVRHALAQGEDHKTREKLKKKPINMTPESLRKALIAGLNARGYRIAAKRT